MTGVAELDKFISVARWSWRIFFRELWSLLRFHRRGRQRNKDDLIKFVILCWRRTGSNWLCGILHNHPEIFMHNELFNETSIHTYYENVLGKWSFSSRDLNPQLFLEEMLSIDRKTVAKSPLKKIKAVGFKSFPEHYWDGAYPNSLLEHTFITFMEDRSMKKVILHRKNLFAVYISMVRSRQTGGYLTTNYDNLKIKINVQELQSFIDRYSFCYRQYVELSRWQRVFYIEYEDLLGPEHDSIIKELTKFLGLTVEVPIPLPETVPQSSGDIRDAILNYEEVEFAWRHTSLSEFLLPVEVKDKANNVNEGFFFPLANIKQLGSYFSPKNVQRWGFLIPICSRNCNENDCRILLSRFYESLIGTTTVVDYKHLHCIFGIDRGDSLYDCPEGHDLVRSIFKDLDCEMITIVGQEGKICKIWNQLAKCAYNKGCDLTVLFGDDVILQTNNWKQLIETSFSDIANSTGLPYGCGCVAFKDISFPGFPTFPVIHRFHFTTFKELVIPSQLFNQGGDPYLFALYNHFGASKFVDAYLNNTLGGKETSTRYVKRHVRWNNEILSTGINLLSNSISQSPLICIDIVVPTYRCDIAILSKIISLRSTKNVRVSFWLIIDNPDATNLDEVRALESIYDNYSVNIREHVKNYGASAARNTGLDYSDADWVILLDDDVTPSEHIIDAYIGAIQRYPSAKIFVGNTKLPPPCSLITHAFVASDLIGSYNIAERRIDPPWGVTANLCVCGRTSRVRFLLEYPKTGGGEDIDYCIRAAKGKGSIIAVPGALAYHPWWRNGNFSCLWHILGWSRGESLCISSIYLKEHVYFSAPNGIEICISVLSISLMMKTIGYYQINLFSIILSIFIVFCLETLWHSSHVNKRVALPYKRNLIGRIFISFLAAWVVMFQEAARFISHIQRGYLQNLFWRFDWVCGKNPDYVIRSIIYTRIRAVLYFSVILGMQLINRQNSVCLT